MDTKDAHPGVEFIPLSATSSPLHDDENMADDHEKVPAEGSFSLPNRYNVEDTHVADNSECDKLTTSQEISSLITTTEPQQGNSPERPRRVGFHPLAQDEDGESHPVRTREGRMSTRRSNRRLDRIKAATQKRRKVLLFVGIVYGTGLVILLTLKSTQLARFQRYIEGPPQALSDVVYLLTEADSRTIFNQDTKPNKTVEIKSKRAHVSNILILRSYQQSTRPLQAIKLLDVDIEILSEALRTHFDRLGKNETGDYPFVSTLNLIGNDFHDETVTLHLREALVHEHCYTTKLLLGRNQNLGDGTANVVSDLIDRDSANGTNDLLKSKSSHDNSIELHFVSLGGTSVTSAGLQRIYDAIGRGEHSFDFLGLDYTDSQDGGGFFRWHETHSFVKESLPSLHWIGEQLQSLSLVGNYLNDDDMSTLVDQLILDDGGKRITNLNLMNNDVGLNGLKSLLLLLAAPENKNRNGQKEETVSVSIVENDQQREANKDETPRALIELHLAMNEKIGDEGAIALANLLRDNNPPLETLTLFQCGITQVGADALLNIFPNNTHLKHLVLQQPQSTSSLKNDRSHTKENEISSDTVAAIRDALQVNWDR